jgi:hypothetical protein
MFPAPFAEFFQFQLRRLAGVGGLRFLFIFAGPIINPLANTALKFD